MLYQQSTLCRKPESYAYRPYITNRVTEIHVIPVYFGWEDSAITLLCLIYIRAVITACLYRMDLVRWCMYVNVNFWTFQSF